MADVETFSEVIDRLYGLPLEEFTPARDTAAKELRAAGERDAAAEVKRLRKPSRLAWALNQVRRHDPEPVNELIAAGQRLQEAQRQLVEAGERGLLRDAAAEARQLTTKLERARERSHALAKQHKEAERGLADAQRAADRAAAAVQRAAASAERARGAAQEAAQRVGELESELRQIR